MTGRRFRRSTGTTSYQAYLASLGNSVPVGPEAVPVAYVFAATCSGTRMLASDLGMPLALVGVSQDPAAEVRAVAARRHGSCLPWTEDGSTFAAEEGWEDWRITRFGQVAGVAAGLAPGVRLVDGLLRVSLYGRLSITNFRFGLAMVLSHLRHSEMCNRGELVAQRIARGRPSLAMPRYTPVAVNDRRRCELVQDIYAVDPRREALLVAIRASSALASASSGYDAAPAG